MKAKDIMSKEVKSIPPEMNCNEALQLIMNMKISGLPVIDGKNHLIGMFTEKEVLKQILPTYVAAVGEFVYHSNPKAVKQRICDFPSKTVKEVMREEVVTIDEDCGLCEAAHVMLNKGVRRILVLNDKKEVTGIVSRGDVLKALFEEYK